MPRVEPGPGEAEPGFGMVGSVPQPARAVASGEHGCRCRTCPTSPVADGVMAAGAVKGRHAGTLASRSGIRIDDPRTHPVAGGGLHRADVSAGRGVAGAVLPARARCAAADQPAGGAQRGAGSRSRDRCHDPGAAGAGHVGQHRRARLPALPRAGAPDPAACGRRQHRAVRHRAQRPGQRRPRMGHAAAEGARGSFSAGVVQRQTRGVGHLRRPGVQAAADRGGGAGDARRPRDRAPGNGVQPCSASPTCWHGRTSRRSGLPPCSTARACSWRARATRGAFVGQGAGRAIHGRAETRRRRAATKATPPMASPWWRCSAAPASTAGRWPSACR